MAGFFEVTNVVPADVVDAVEVDGIWLIEVDGGFWFAFNAATRAYRVL